MSQNIIKKKIVKKIVPAPIEQDIPIHPDPIDLLSNYQKFDLNNENRAIIEQFSLLITQIEHQIIWIKDPEEKKKHRFRLMQMKKAITSFENYPGKLSSGKQAQTIKGIGKGIGSRIDEILATGTLAELTERQYVTDYTRVVQELCKVTGIGEVKARQLIDNFNVKGVDDLQDKFLKEEIKVDKNQLTHHIVVGLKWYEDILQKIPQNEIDSIDTQILQPSREKIDPKLLVQVCGSYRRGRDFSGDIDVLITHPELITEAQVNVSTRKYLIEFVNELQNLEFIVDSLTDSGRTKYMGVCKLAGISPVGRRIDIRFVPFDSYAPALLYFTGSGHFNKIFRAIANSRNFTVNEYGIFHYEDKKKGEKIPVYSETDIFKIVGVKYLTPKERDM